MKRSEAARKIREFLLYKPLDGNWEYQILEAVELIGMMPPYKDGEEPFGYNEGYIERPLWEKE